MNKSGVLLEHVLLMIVHECVHFMIQCVVLNSFHERSRRRDPSRRTPAKEDDL